MKAIDNAGVSPSTPILRSSSSNSKKSVKKAKSHFCNHMSCLFIFIAIVTSCTKTAETPVLQITDMRPRSAPAGAMVVLTGSGFSENCGHNTVQFNDQQAVVLYCTANQLVVEVPRRAGVGPVSVTVFGKTVFGPIFNLSTVGGRPE